MGISSRRADVGIVVFDQTIQLILACARSLAKQPVSTINTMIQKITSVCV